MGEENEYLLELLKEKNQTNKMLQGMLNERNDEHKVLENRIWFLQNQGRRETLGGKNDINKLVDELTSLFHNCFQSVTDNMQDMEKEIMDIKKQQTVQFQILTNMVQEMSEELKSLKKGDGNKSPSKNGSFGVEVEKALDETFTPPDKTNPMNTSHSSKSNISTVLAWSKVSTWSNKVLTDEYYYHGPSPKFQPISDELAKITKKPSVTVKTAKPKKESTRSTPKVEVSSATSKCNLGFKFVSAPTLKPTESPKVEEVKDKAAQPSPFAFAFTFGTKQTGTPVTNPEPAKFIPLVVPQNSSKIETPLKGEDKVVKFY